MIKKLSYSMLTIKEYEEKMSELRKERNRHQLEVDRINKEMDELESDKNSVDITVGEYISFDRRKSNGYLYYFHVHDYQKRPRGVTLYGSGFSNCELFIKKDNTLTIMWDEVDNLKIVTEKEFYEAFDNHVTHIRNELATLKTSLKFSDLFKKSNDCEDQN